MDKRYNPQEAELEIYKTWEQGGYFTPEISASSRRPQALPFCIIMPPPNANDPLHMGHAFFVALQDLMIRYHRMRGDLNLWLPGADHAGIETQYVFEKKLAKKGKSRFDFRREEFYQMVRDYVQKNIITMKKQLKSLGASCDWSRFKYTLDSDIIKIVSETFYQLLQDDLAYRDERIINFCTECATAFSDLEVKHKERIDPLYYIKYGPFTLATVRPETKFGDTAVAVHPKDKRYQKWVGKEIEVCGLTAKFKLKVVADEAVNPKFGTGVIKVTPAHDPVDFEIGLRHNLERKRVIDFNGKLTAITGKYGGWTCVKARKKVAQDLEKNGLLVKVEKNYRHTVGTCYRCGTVIEPMILPQWFIKVNQKLKGGKLSLKEMGILPVKTKRVKIIPKKWEKQYLHWMENLRDWNISRQIWWGIPIPVRYCADCNKIKKYGHITWIPKEAKPIINFKKCPDCGGENLIRDPDTFDTWFSSAQWPFASLMACSKTQLEFKLFYPTSVMETAYDILYFWVARMIMMGIYRIGKIPFKTVYLHGLLRDVNRLKMSKSKGNVVNPLEMSRKYGSDALRMALIVGSSAGNDIVLWEKKIKGYRNFANKIWNVGRFIKMQNEKRTVLAKGLSLAWSKKKFVNQEDKKILQDLSKLIKNTTQNLENLRFSQAAEELYHFIWHRLADKYLEYAKKGFENSQQNPKKAEAVLAVLNHVYLTSLCLLHPFMPFLTEKLWRIFAQKKPLIITPWPKVNHLQEPLLIT